MNKEYIVKNKQIFTKIIKNGKKISNNSFVIYYQKNDLNHSRYGISVGSKLGNAVFRNKYKRRIRMIIHLNPILKYTKNDYIILLRKNAVNLDYQKLKEDLNTLLYKLKEIK